MYGEVNILYGAYVAIQGQLAKRRTEAQIQVLTAQKAVENVETEDEKKQAERKLTAARAREKEIIERTKRETGALARNLYAWHRANLNRNALPGRGAASRLVSGNGKGG